MDVHMNNVNADVASFLVALSSAESRAIPPLSVSFRPLAVDELAYGIQHVIVESIITNATDDFSTDTVMGWVMGLPGVKSCNLVAFGKAPVVPAGAAQHAGKVPEPAATGAMGQPALPMGAPHARS